MSTAQIDVLDQIVALHDQAGEHLKNFRETHRKMLGSFSSFGGGVVSAPIATPTTPEKKESKPAASPASSSTETPDNDRSLQEAVWLVLNRPENRKNGLRVSQIIDAIKNENLWQTSGNLGSMVHTSVYNLKKKELVVRGDNKTYTIKPGASLS